MYAENVGDNIHMTLMKIIEFSRPPPPSLSIYIQNYFSPLTLEVQSFKRKHDPRVTIKVTT